MQIWPALDLRGGKCVRLQQGDSARGAVFGNDPAAMARQWVDGGAQCLHLVDLDGARDGTAANKEAVTAILAAVNIPCELGGGVRSEATIQAWPAAGITRLITGTKALKEPDWVRRMCQQYPDRLVLGIDARDGQVATDGWLNVSDLSATKMASQYASEPIAAIVYTDIATDGMMAGPNLAAMQEMNNAIDVPVVASGGITSAEDVRQLAQIGMAGCIIGRSLYEGQLTIADAVNAANEVSA